MASIHFFPLTCPKYNRHLKRLSSKGYQTMLSILIGLRYNEIYGGPIQFFFIYFNPHPINTREDPTIAITIANILLFVKGSCKKIRAKINIKIVAVWLRMLAVDAFVRLILIIQDDIPKYVEKKVAINKGPQIFLSLNGEMRFFFWFLNIKIISGTIKPGSNRNQTNHNCFPTSPLPVPKILH